MNALRGSEAAWRRWGPLVPLYAGFWLIVLPGTSNAADHVIMVIALGLAGWAICTWDGPPP